MGPVIVSVSFFIFVAYLVTILLKFKTTKRRSELNENVSVDSSSVKS